MTCACKENEKIIMTIETFDVIGRTKGRLLKKLSPIWWFMNDQEPKPPDWYLPNGKGPSRAILWYLRNPLKNFGNYVVGVYNRNSTVHGTGR